MSSTSTSVQGGGSLLRWVICIFLARRGGGSLLLWVICIFLAGGVASLMCPLMGPEGTTTALIGVGGAVSEIDDYGKT